MIFRLFFTYLLNLFDLAVTSHWVKRFGIEIEGNPIGRWLYETDTVHLVKTVGMGVLILFLYFALKAHPRWRWVSWLLFISYGTVALYHVCLAINLSTLGGGFRL